MLMRALRFVDHWVARALRATMLACLVALFLLVTFIVLTRLFSWPSAGWTDELVELFFAWLIFSGVASLWRERGHFAVTLLADTVRSARVRKVLDDGAELACLVFLLVFTYQSWTFIVNASEASPVFSISKAYWYASTLVAGAIMIAYSLARLGNSLFGASGKTQPGSKEPIRYEA
ncbi:MAG: TRAP transporter small permease subunit [Burkholderiales bacterium]|nr:MAG: TRAP transporter small permease subunit [Burkholderiales bacterium]